MISGIDLTATCDYILANDKENPTIWKLGLLPSDVFGKISSEASKAGDIETAYALLSVSLRGWENFTVPYKTQTKQICGRSFDVVPSDLLASIPLTAITELTKKVMQLNGLSEQEVKN